MRLKLAPPRTQHSDMVTALCWTPFNEMYSCSDDGTISKWDLDGEHQGKVCDLGTCYSARRTTPPQRQRLIHGPTSATDYVHIPTQANITPTSTPQSARYVVPRAPDVPGPTRVRWAAPPLSPSSAMYRGTVVVRKGPCSFGVCL